ncbi:hypothetical protein [Pseudemcibacter aquimaris]|uniref:hypothetical protein n=1 Tax=Pseudemcibacter aquimaris TaxID=2857064 RepID=UPI0020123C9C|nr:hypothetical protein [Pseudemcibacter aquimaris]MCC3861130.1 hypothetical protein [Pseudemcibacter aquimaris]WDU59947.1 hypothetical protein KW060_06720 [Pseudemcibacter aquimaris]
MSEEKNLSDYQDKIEWLLLFMRASIFIVMFAWTVDKFTDPSHGVAILKGFYFIDGVGEQLVMILGGLEMLLILAFVAGAFKKYTYGLILLFHGLTTFASFDRYIPPDVSLTFFAAWPMLAACATLYILRDFDKKFAVQK